MKTKLITWFKSKVDTLCLKIEKSIISDKSLKCKVVFGPVYSRRLGTVLGINNVKPGFCSYDCIYCPGGKTTCCSICTNNCLSPFELYNSVKNKLNEINKAGKKIEYILFAGSGDPCMDSSLSKEILLLREFGYKIAVFTNSALLWNKNIRENLMFADYVSVKVDTVNEETWLKLNRPHQRLHYNLILDGIKQFAGNFKGTLTTETTLIKNINDNPDELVELKKYLDTFPHKSSHFMTPVYPPSENYAVSPDEQTLKILSGIIKENIPGAVQLCCPETEEFLATDDFENELLGLLALHPVSENAITIFVETNDKKEKLSKMFSNNIIRKIEYNGRKYLALNGTN
jgi:wyosine [tRNA(Phe)-imidazoG37] synthetase (radical SAM superfamily)